MKKIGGVIVVLIAIVMMVMRILNPSHHNTLNHNNNVPVNTPANAPFNRNIDHLILTRHARCRMECRHINEEELKEILHEGTVNYAKSQPDDSRGPKYALEGFTHEHQHLRVIFAPETNAVVVVTCIDLDNEWACGSCN